MRGKAALFNTYDNSIITINIFSCEKKEYDDENIIRVKKNVIIDDNT